MPYGFKKRKLGPLAFKQMEENTLPYDECPEWMQESFVWFSHERPEWIIEDPIGVYHLKKLTEKEILEG